MSPATFLFSSSSSQLLVYGCGHANMKTIKLEIETLYPYECGAVRIRYNKTLPLYEAGKHQEVDPPTVLQLKDGSWMVIDGCNRVKAAKDAGYKYLEFEIDTKPDQDMRPYEEAAKLRGKKQQRGFGDAYPIFDSESQRTEATKEETGISGRRF